MFQNKMDILLFFLCIGILIFTKKIFDNHAYNRRSETIHMNLITCLNITLLNKIWRNVLTIIILGIWRSIVRAIKKSNYLYCNALSNKFQAEWNVAKINSNGKCESEIFFFTSVANLPNLSIDSKLLNLREVSLRGILFYIICVFVKDIDRQKSCRHGWDNLFQKSSVEREYCYENLVIS